jgi:hypothetical protein
MENSEKGCERVEKRGIKGTRGRRGGVWSRRVEQYTLL